MARKSEIWALQSGGCIVPACTNTLPSALFLLCRKALQAVTVLRQAAAVAATVAAAACLLPFLALLNPATTAAATRAAGPAVAIPLAAATGAAWLPGVLAAVLGAAWLLLGRLRNQFIWVDYIHNEK